MSKVLGIIAEYNPFHNGHLYHLEESKKITGSKYVVAVISGNFTQRGDTSIIDKWTKTKMALDNGCDLVIELPLIYSISSAENFAAGGVKILNSLKVVDYISFGAETSDVNILDKIANILYEEPKEYKSLLASQLNKGMSFPKARQNALMMYLNDIRDYAEALSAPNNILGIEYIKSLKKLKSKIVPVPIERYETGYNDLSYTSDIASASAIRNIVKNGGFQPLKSLIPKTSFQLLTNQIKLGQNINDLSVFEKQIIYNLRVMSINEIANLPDVSEGLEYALKKAASVSNTLDDLIENIKSKRYTLTRIRRILLYSLLKLTKKDMEISKKVNPYIRVLGFNSKGKYLLSEAIKQNPRLEVITSVKKFLDSSFNKNLINMLEKDILATNIYTIGYKNNSISNLDYTNKIIIKE